MTDQNRLKGRLCAFFIALILSQAASAALTVIWSGDFETGQHKATGTGGTLYNYWTSSTPAPDASGTCVAVGGSSPLESNSIVTYPVHSGTYANKQTLYWTCDYRPVNGNTLQKPRNETGGNASGYAEMDQAHTYWFTFSILLPAGWISDNQSSKINLWQTHKSQPRTAMSLVSVGEGLVSGVGKMNLDISDITSGGSYSNGTSTVATWNTTTDEWHTFLVNIKPCYTTNLADTSCGFLKVYLSNAERRGAGTEKTPIYSGTGRNMERADTTFHMTANTYKPNWHCSSSLQSSYSACMANPPPSNTVTYNSGTGKAEPISVYFDDLKIATAADSDTIDDAITALSPDFSSAPSTPSDPTIIRMNAGNPLDINDYSYFTTDTSTAGAWGIYDVSVSDGVNSEDADAWASNATGGCITLGTMSTVSGGPVTVTMERSSPGFDSARGGSSDAAITSWGTFNVSLASYSSGDACFDNATSGATITNTAASAGLANSPTDGSYRVSTVSGKQVVAAFAIANDAATNPTGAVRLRIDCGGGYVNYGGLLGSMTSATLTQTTGTGATIRERTSRGVNFVEIEYTANASETCGLKAGPNVATSGAKIHLLHAQLWNDRQPTSMLYSTTLNKPDTTPPLLSECFITEDATTHAAQLGCNSDEPATLRAVVTNSSTVPTETQIKAGKNDTGSAAVYSGSIVIPATGNSLTTPVLDPYTNRYAYFVATDNSGNDSSASTAETYLAAVSPPSTTKKIAFRFSETNDTSLMCRSASAGQSAPYNSADDGSGDIFIVIGSGNPRTPPATPFPTVLAYDLDATIVDGEYVLDETKLEYGSINALETGDQGYYMWASNASGSCRWSSPIEVVLE